MSDDQQTPAGKGAQGRELPAWANRVTAVAKKVEVVSTISAYAASAFLVIVTVLTLLDIVARNLFRMSVITGVTELSSWMMAAIAWLALSYAMKTDGHIQVRILVDRLPRKLRRVLAVVLAVMGIALLVFLIVSMWDRFLYIIRQGTQGAEVKISVAWVYGFVLIGAVLFLIELLAKFWYSLLPFFGRTDQGGIFGSDLDDLKWELREEDQAALFHGGLDKDG